MPLQLSLFDAPELPRSSGEVAVARGALAAEAMLLSRIDALLGEARKNPALLARPVRIVVPSRSLRLHVAAAIVRARGRSAAGVVIQTLHALAFEVLERAGEEAPHGMPLADILAQRLARTEPALRRGLGDLVDGYGTVVGTVRDLLDAGMEPVHAEAADEALASDGPYAATRAEVERARALARTAARTEALMRRIGLGRVSTLLRRAAEILAADPARALPSRAILVHGFADATGVATDLIQELLRLGAALILDHPPAPGRSLSPGTEERAGERGSGTGAERAFTERFAERLAGVSRFVPAPPGDAPRPPQVERFEAVGSEAEVRELARRVRALLAGGARPEGIGVVARDLAPYALPLRRHLLRLGVPFSGLGARGALEPAGRRARAFLELLRRGEEVPSDRWLDAVGALPRVLLADLRLAFYSLGAGRLRDVADLRPEAFLKNGRYALPIRQGLRTAGAGEGEIPEAEEGETYAARRTVDGRPLRAAVRTAGRVRERLAEWPDEERAAEHFRRLRALLMSDLGWEPGAEDAAPVLAALAELEREVPGDFPLNRDELRLLLSGALAEAGTSELGGQGGGVQALTVMEARGRTFEHLFVLGMNRDLFPRGVREDPLLPDGLRRVLRRVLPDVPVKGTGFDEERYLFAGLLAASPSVTLSWQSADDEGKALSPSPLLRGERAAEKAPPLYASGGDRLRPADEHAVIAALHGTRGLFSRILPAALAEARAGLPAAFDLRPDELAAARMAVLDELDPDLRTPEGRAARSRLGPFFGFVGAVASAADPRRTDLFVTSLEKLAGCPWQLFLGRLLRLEPTPDPLAALPGADPVLLGNLVHAALKRIVLSPLSPPTVETPRGASPAAAPSISRDPFDVAGTSGGGDAPRGVSTVGDAASCREVPWPASADLDRILRAEAERLLAEEGIAMPGLAGALAERARPLVDVAGEMDWGRQGAVLSVVRVEESESLAVRDAAGNPRTISFRADRVDRTSEGLRCTDYKTGRPISAARKPDVRRRHFLERVKQGTHLQAVAYLLAAGEPAIGRYLFLRPGLGEREDRELAVGPEDRDFAEAFAGAAGAVLGAWDAGSFFPRVVDPSGRDEPGRCSWCAVAEACVRGDSGARLRLFEWTERAKERADLDPAESALLRVWRLAERGGREETAPEGDGEAQG